MQAEAERMVATFLALIEGDTKLAESLMKEMTFEGVTQLEAEARNLRDRAFSELSRRGHKA